MKIAVWTFATLLVPLVAVGVAGCAGEDSGGDAPADDASTSEQDSAGGGLDSSVGPGRDATTGHDGASGDATGAKDGPAPPDAADAATACVTTTDAGIWANMACSATACDGRPGVACGYSATNEGQGYLCTCENPSWADPWGCVPADAGGGKACPPADAGADASSPSDAATADAGCVTTTWANMACSATACDDRPGLPCGYTPTNEGQGYLCTCENPSWADPWGCVPADAGVGKACPSADAGTDASTAVDAGTPDAATACVTTTDAGTWANMACSATACDKLPGTPCGYTPTNEGQGYLCTCENPAWADPWGCMPADAGGGKACP